MYIQKITLNNFGSYYGKVSFNFEHDTGRPGYAIFGDIGRGKTTLVKSILWCLYGKVEAIRVSSTGKTLRAKRPCIDADQMIGEYSKRFNLPLLNFRAFTEGDFAFSVEIEFEHQDRKHHLVREIVSQSKLPRSDNDIVIQPHLTVDGRVTTAALIQPKIEEIIPERISQFFFVEADSINAYSHLLHADDTGMGIVDDIESILGLPALKHSRNDFEFLASSMLKQLGNLRTSDKRNREKKKKIEVLDEEIRQYQNEIGGYDGRLGKIVKEIREIDGKLEGHVSTQELMGQIKSLGEELKGLEESKTKNYTRRSQLLSNNAWKFLIQTKLEVVINRLLKQSSAKEELEENKTTLSLQNQHLENEIYHGGAVCKVCNQKTELNDPKKREMKASEMAKNTSKIEDLENQIKKIGDPNADAIVLSRYRDGADCNEIKDLEDLIGMCDVDIYDKKEKMKRFQLQLMKGDVVTTTTLAQDRERLIEQRGSVKALKSRTQDKLERAAINKDKLTATLTVDSEETPKTRELENCAEVYQWLDNIFINTMESYKNEARKSVEKLATEAWMNMVAEPKKYRKIQINHNWSTEVVGARGHVLPIGNPGHRQTLAVCIFDGLRKTSRREFPTFFDNPGGDISAGVLENMVKHFWNESSSQIVMLSHSGGLEKEETMNKFGSKLARAWELSYSVDDTTTIVDEVKM
jgi:DNA sulfur modification protein DndD